MDRTRAIFDFVFALPHRKCTFCANQMEDIFRRFLFIPKYKIRYVAVESGLDPVIHESRYAREQKSLKNFIEKTRFEFADINEIHDWIFLKHAAYSTSRLNNNNEKSKMSAETLKTY